MAWKRGEGLKPRVTGISRQLASRVLYLTDTLWIRRKAGWEERRPFESHKAFEHALRHTSDVCNLREIPSPLMVRFLICKMRMGAVLLAGIFRELVVVYVNLVMNVCRMETLVCRHFSFSKVYCL